MAWFGLQVTRAAHRGHRVHRGRHSGGRGRLLCSVSGPRTGRTSNRSADRSCSIAHQLFKTLRGSQSLEPGQRPRPRGRAMRRVGVSAGVVLLGTPLWPGYNSPERPAAAGGRRRAPGSGETGRAEGCICRDSGGLRGYGSRCAAPRGPPSPRISEEGVWSSGAPRGPGGVPAGGGRASPGRSSAALSFPSISRTWTSRACAWGFCCPWWPPWISDTTTRKGWRRS